MEDDKVEKLIERLTRESEERTKRYLGALKEDTDDKLAFFKEYTQDIATIKEAVKEIPAIKESLQDLPIMKEAIKNITKKLDLTFDKVGEIAVDVEVLKESAKDYERRLQLQGR